MAAITPTVVKPSVPANTVPDVDILTRFIATIIGIGLACSAKL